MPEVYSKSWQGSKMMRYIEKPDIVPMFYSNIFRTYFGTFSDIQPCSGQCSAMFRHIEKHQGILKQILALLWHTEPYSELCITV